MFRILIAVDGSEHSDRAVRHVVRSRGRFPDAEVHLLNVQPALPGDVGRFVSAEQLRDYHESEGEKCLRSARQILDEAGMRHVLHIGVGEPSRVITHYAQEKGVDEIVMGARGLGSVVGLVMGSVSMKVIALASAPVLIVR